MTDSTNLTELEREMLDFERTWWKEPGAKEAEIRRRFDVSATRYYQRLLATLENPEALLYAPITVRRLQRLRGRRRAERGGVAS